MMGEKYPFQVSCGKNEAMNSFDVLLQVGGFADSKAAADFADRLVEFMAREGNATLKGAS